MSCRGKEFSVLVLISDCSIRVYFVVKLTGCTEY